MFAAINELVRIELTLYTDALIAHGAVLTAQRRVSDILNQSETPYLVLESVTVTDHSGRVQPIAADVAQINLDAVLFAAVDEPAESAPGLRTAKIKRVAIISIPPYRVTGTLHLLAGSTNLREALVDLKGRFLPVTDASFEAPSVGVAAHRALMLAVNHQRAQILANYREPGDRPVEHVAEVGPASGEAAEDVNRPVPRFGGDPWAGTDWSGGDEEEEEEGSPA